MEDGFDCLIADINGIMRGQRAPLSAMKNLVSDGSSWPRSLYAMRLDGGVVEETGIGIRSGDPDYPAPILADTVAPTPWRGGSMQAVSVMQTPTGEAFYADPRQVLAAVVAQCHADGLYPVLAVELEFYLLAAKMDESRCDLYSLEALDAHEDFIRLVQQSAVAQNIRLGSITSEYAAGQFEINLTHGEPLRACLEALLFRRLVRAAARACHHRATFMAKPDGGRTGSGMHLHLSLLDEQGNFIFTDDDILLAATAGALSILGEAMAFFAPFGNSYRRFVSHSYAPVAACWGHENRAAAVRLPTAEGAGRRLELRIAGADANPYLAAAALLSGVRAGVLAHHRPPPEMKPLKTPLPIALPSALTALQRAKTLPQIIDRRFLQLYQQVKASEWQKENARVSDEERRFYCGVV